MAYTIQESGDIVIVSDGYGVSNVAPCTRQDEAGYSIDNPIVFASSGVETVPLTFTEYQMIDNSFDSAGGCLNLVAANRVTVESGSGGFHVVSGGNVSIIPAGGIFDVLAPAAVSLATRVMNLTAAEIIKMNSPVVNIAAQNTIIDGDTKVKGNALVSGGLFVNGELFVNHITSQRQDMWTDDCDIMYGSINGGQTFMVMNGDGLAAGAPPPVAVDVLLSARFPVIGEVVGLPVTIKFPMGFKIVSAGLINGKGDVAIPAHCHRFDSVQMELLDKTADVWGEAEKMNEMLSKAKSMTPNGGGLNKFLSDMQKRIQKRITDWGKRVIKEYLPF